MTPLIILAVIVGLFLLAGVRVLAEYERGVVFRLGRFAGVRQAGLRWIIPGVDRMVRVSLREVVMDVPPQDVITRDNVSVKVNAVLYFRVLHPENAIIKVENYLYGTSQLAQTTLRSVCGQQELDGLLTERETLNRQLQSTLDEGTDPWGVKVRAVEIKHIDLPVDMQRAMAKQAEAERERRAKIIHAEGEAQAAERLRQASEIMAQSPYTLQLRYLQTLSDIATENSSTIIFPLPLDLIEPIIAATQAARARGLESGGA
jgi:regulator of protease activity HflC (stomatin/prohibitin superfamily)